MTKPKRARKKKSIQFYDVTIPIAGSARFSRVPASSEDEATEKVWDLMHTEGFEPEVEWEYNAAICERNVLHASCNEISAEPSLEEEPEHV